MKKNDIKLSSYKEFKTSFIQKNEFSHFLIMKYTKKNYTSIIINNINKTSNSLNNEVIKEKKLLIKYLGKEIEEGGFMLLKIQLLFICIKEIIELYLKNFGKNVKDE